MPHIFRWQADRLQAAELQKGKQAGLQERPMKIGWYCAWALGALGQSLSLLSAPSRCSMMAFSPLVSVVYCNNWWNGSVALIPVAVLAQWGACRS